MKRLFKKNQIIIATLAVMIAIAGYLNYSGILFGESGDSTTEANADLANQELLDISQDDIESSTEDIESNDSDVEGTPGEACPHERCCRSYRGPGKSNKRAGEGRKQRNPSGYYR